MPPLDALLDLITSWWDLFVSKLSDTATIVRQFLPKSFEMPTLASLDTMQWMLVGAVAFSLLALATTGSSAAARETKVERKHRSTSSFEKLLQWISPPDDPWLVGDIVVSFKWLAHCLVFGTTGSGKSTFVRQRILRNPLGLPGLITRIIWLFTDKQWPRRPRRGCLLFAGNESKPFIAAVLELLERGYPASIWTPDPVPGSGFGLDVLEGPPDNVAQRLIAMQPVGQGNTGLQSGAVEGMIVDTIFQIDRDGETRNFANILKTIRKIGIRDLDSDGKPTGESRDLTRQEQTGLENWCTRLGTLRRRLGASIGSDLKLSDALERGEVVLVQGSSYANPNTIDQLANMITFYAMWLVTAVGNFDLIIDEPGAVPPDTFTRLLTATRAQGVRIMICPQSLEQIDRKVREMCTTTLLLGLAGASPETRDLASRIVEHDIDPVDFTLLKPQTWREKASFWTPRRGLLSLTGYLLDNGRLDLVQTAPCNLDILDRWKKGSIPKLPADFTDFTEADEEQDGPAPTGTTPESPETASNADAESVADDALSVLDDVLSDVVVSEDVEPVRLSERAVLNVACPEVAMGIPDGRRVWGKGRAESCWTLLSTSVKNAPESLEKPHRFWTGGGNGTRANRPKTQAKALYGDDAGKRTTVTVYIWWYELISGKSVPSSTPTIDHLCHTYDDSCPGPNACSLPGCEDPAHLFGQPCQHTSCYEFEHLEPVTLKDNARRQAEQKARHQSWLRRQTKKAA